MLLIPSLTLLLCNIGLLCTLLYCAQPSLLMSIYPQGMYIFVEWGVDRSHAHSLVFRVRIQKQITPF